MESPLSIDYIRIFYETELYTNNMNGQNVLYRCTVSDGYLYFLLYDFQKLYMSKQTYIEMSDMNRALNPSLELNSGDVSTLIKFLTENIIKAEENLTILKEGNRFVFEIILNILKVRWEFITEIIDDVKFYIIFR
jgi:hypothetical protein